MSVFTKIKGIIGDAFHLGGPEGPQIKKGSLTASAASAIDARNSADSAYAVVRGATPEADNDLATKEYVDTHTSPGGTHQVIVPFTHASGAVSSTAVVPADAIVTSCSVEISTAFDSAAPTVHVWLQQGEIAYTAAGTDDSFLKHVGIYHIPQMGTLTHDGEVELTVVPDDALSGAGRVLLEYTIPLV